MRRLAPFVFLASTLCALAAGAEPPTTRPANASKAWLLHLPGIAGLAQIDQNMIQGLRDGGLDGEIETYDWTVGNPGIGALLAREHNKAEAKKVAEKIVARARAEPKGQILLTSHSGGSGLCVWALEDLPDDVKVDAVLLLSPALSPKYPLAKALSHVRAKAYAFTSPNDVLILGAGTGLLGTIDGVKGDAAGKVGFGLPDDAGPATRELYAARLVARPYDPGWMKYGNLGDHVGVLSQAFASAILAPLLLAELPTAAAPATLPSTRAGSAEPRPGAPRQ